MGLSASGLLVERVVAAARSGAPELAADALARLTETMCASGTNWALGSRRTAQVDRVGVAPRL